MFAELLLFATLQIGPFWSKSDDQAALRPLWSSDEVAQTTDVVWPLFTSHRDWWRFCWFIHSQEGEGQSCQFDVMPFWFNGTDRRGNDYWGLFPLWGRHPHILFLHDWEFALWPLWMRYRMPRPSGEKWMTSSVVLFPFFHWRDDGAWGVWPLCGLGRQRESDHAYALWPLVTWADYRSDRDTAGAGKSWMVWPIWGDVSRERESQWMFLPPFFSFAETTSPVWSARGNSCKEIRLRCPWPFFEVESGVRRDRLNIFPFYEQVDDKRISDGKPHGGVTRFGWRLAEFYRSPEGECEESRIFPVWLKNRTHLRLWPFWSTTVVDQAGEVRASRCLELFPIRWVPAVDRNWAPFWTFYESVSNPVCTEHSLFWGLFKWRSFNR